MHVRKLANLRWVLSTEIVMSPCLVHLRTLMPWAFWCWPGSRVHVHDNDILSWCVEYVYFSRPDFVALRSPVVPPYGGGGGGLF